MSAIASAIVCAVKFVNSFARRQHLLDIAAKPIDVDSNIQWYPAPLFLFLFQFCPKCNQSVYWNPLKYSCEAKEIYLARDRRRDGQKTGRTEAAMEKAKISRLRCSIGCRGRVNTVSRPDEVPNNNIFYEFEDRIVIHSSDTEHFLLEITWPRHSDIWSWQ